MEYIGAGLAALGVIGPGIGIGILTGMAATAIGRNPDAAPQIRAQFILGAAFAEGLGVLAIVVAILAIVLQPTTVGSSSWTCLRSRRHRARAVPFALPQEAGEAAGLQINFFWVIVSALNFIVFLVLLYGLRPQPAPRLLAERRARIEQGLRDAEQAGATGRAPRPERVAALQRHAARRTRS